MITVKTLVEAAAWARDIDTTFQLFIKLEGIAGGRWGGCYDDFRRNLEVSFHVAAERSTTLENFSGSLVGDGSNHSVAINKLKRTQTLIKDEWHRELIGISQLFLGLKLKIETFTSSLNHLNRMEPDVELMCDWLSQSANVWAHVRNDILLLQEHLKFAAGAVTGLRLKKELQLIREIHSPLGAGLKGYALRMNMYGLLSSRATLSENNEP